jgi:hypothetical protein
MHASNKTAVSRLFHPIDHLDVMVLTADHHDKFLFMENLLSCIMDVVRCRLLCKRLWVKCKILNFCRLEEVCHYFTSVALYDLVHWSSVGWGPLQKGIDIFFDITVGSQVKQALYSSSIYPYEHFDNAWRLIFCCHSHNCALIYCWGDYRGLVLPCLKQCLTYTGVSLT